MTEISQIELEQLETRIARARERFLVEIGKHPEAARLYSEFRELEIRGVDARRARREAEIREASGEV